MEIIKDKIFKFTNGINANDWINLIEDTSKDSYPLERVTRRPHLTMELPYLFSANDSENAVKLRCKTLAIMLPAIQAYMGVNHLVSMEPKKTFITVSKLEDGAWMKNHKDDLENKSNFICMFYINEYFSGGELVFPELDYTYKPQSGDVVIYPAKLLHGVTKLSGGPRYNIGYGFKGPIDPS